MHLSEAANCNNRQRQQANGLSWHLPVLLKPGIQRRNSFRLDIRKILIAGWVWAQEHVTCGSACEGMQSRQHWRFVCFCLRANEAGRAPCCTDIHILALIPSIACIVGLTLSCRGPKTVRIGAGNPWPG